MKLSGIQIEAGLVLGKMTREELCREAAIAKKTLNDVLNEKTAYRDDTILKIRSVLEMRGVEFIENQGVRRRSSGIQIFEGSARFQAFYDFMYEHVKAHGGDICLSIGDERLLSKYRKDPIVHYERMQALFDEKVFQSFRILANKSNFATKYSYNKYRWRPGVSISPTAFYTFGDCLALISFVHDPSPYVVVLQSGPIAQSYRQAFDVEWEAAKSPPRQS